MSKVCVALVVSVRDQRELMIKNSSQYLEGPITILVLSMGEATLSALETFMQYREYILSKWCIYIYLLFV